ncbi:MAG TPA: M23 family metallopeptidase [Bacteroidetes bacterium]|nr:M23 family metallopeptidase [Bacteroidota bacterium]HIL57374.1 M23 family metallopeptidase [Rhodothermales bacterium]
MDSPPPRRRSGCLVPVLLLAALAVAAAVAVPSLRRPLYLAELASLAPPDTLPVPVAGVTPPQLADTWGAPRSNGRTHEGIDIFADRGTPVVSATEGVVLGVGTNSLGGNVVRVMGPGREVHYYAHLDAHADELADGQRVMAGDTLGTVGTSGNAAGTPPHLHYGIYRAGGAVNPYPRLAP